MKIAIDIRAAAGNKAGKGWYTYNLVRALLRSDHGNKYILYTEEIQEDFKEFKNAEQRAYRIKGVRWHSKVIKDLKQEKPDLFIAPSSYIIPAFAPKGLKTLVVVHDLIALLFPKQHNRKAVLIEKATLRWAMKKSSYIVAVSENTKKDLITKFDLSNQKITVVYPAVDSAYKPLDTSMRSFVDNENLPARFFLSIGTLIPRKNIKRLLEAHKKLIDFDGKRKEQPHLVVIGDRGWKFSEVFERLQELGTAEYVIFKGYVPEKDLVKYYNLAIALVFPSLYEGFGLPALEAMQSSCPVITSNTSSLPEVVGEAALMINPESREELAEAMKKIYHDDDLRIEMMVKGMKRAELFDWGKSAKEMLKIIKNLK